MLVRPGGRIPVDGVVLDGSAVVNQASITGESVPVEKHVGNQVFAASICERGALRIFTERVGPDTTFGQIIRLVKQAEAAKAPIQRFADRFTAYYIPVVLAVAVGTYLVGGSATAAVATVLVACSCAIAMATPITVLAAVGRAARRGIVVKGGRYLEALAKVDTVVMDKTGTVTIGRPEVTEVVAVDGQSEATLLGLAAGLALYIRERRTTSVQLVLASLVVVTAIVLAPHATSDREHDLSHRRQEWRQAGIGNQARSAFRYRPTLWR